MRRFGKLAALILVTFSIGVAVGWVMQPSSTTDRPLLVFGDRFTAGYGVLAVLPTETSRWALIADAPAREEFSKGASFVRYISPTGVSPDPPDDAGLASAIIFVGIGDDAAVMNLDKRTVRWID